MYSLEIAGDVATGAARLTVELMLKTRGGEKWSGAL
jgi:hypothetical protein